MFQGPKGKGFPRLAGIYFVGCPEVGRSVGVKELSNALYDVAMEMELCQGKGVEHGTSEEGRWEGGGVETVLVMYS